MTPAHDDCDNDADARRGELAAALVPVAADLVYRVHEGSRGTVGALLHSLTGEQLRALPVVLAAMVDPDRSLGELLGWVTWDEHGRPLPGAPPAAPQPAAGPARAVRPCGTHTASSRHRNRGEDPCPRCRDAERAYQRARPRRGAGGRVGKEGR